MNPVLLQKTIDSITDAGKEAVSLVVNITTGDNHPEYEKAVILGTAEAIKELAKSDDQNNVRIYENIKAKREKRDFYNLSNVLHKFAMLVKIKPKEKIEDDNDFFWNTIEHAKSVSNEEVQNLIAKIIAGEYGAPGTYSMHTLQILKTLGKSEIELLERICSLIISDDGIPQAIFSLPENAQSFMNEIGIDFGSLQTLQSLGLFLPNYMCLKEKNLNKNNIEVSYLNERLTFIPENENCIDVAMPNFYGLSLVGKQILRHLNPQYNEKYFVWLKENYKIPNYKLSE